MNAPANTPPNQGLEQGFLLGYLRVDPAEGVVTGPGGREKLDPKVMDVLVLMARHAGHVVLREDLLAQLWPNAVVTDDALTRCFYELRRQLSLAGGSEKYKAMLETLPKRGYRLNAEIKPLQQPTDANAQGRPRRRMLAMGIGIAAALALVLVIGLRFAGLLSPSEAANSIAVLPFVDMSANQDQQYFSDGIAEEIRDRLENIRQLRVIARTSSFSFRDESVDIPEIAAKLDVTHVLEGSVRRSGNSLRITAQLIEASSNSQVWSETYDREAGDQFAIQDEIAASVAAALSVTLGSQSLHGSVPASTDAYELFLQGQFFYDRRAPGDIALAAKYYQEALVIDPNYARAWAALAGTYSLLAFDGDITPEAGLAKQGIAARKAVELDPNLAEGQARLSQYYWDTGDRKTAHKILDKAIDLDPNDPLVLNFVAGIAMRDGDIQGAIEKQRRLVARDPRSAAVRANMGTYLQAVGRLDEAKAELLKALELNPNFGWGVELAIARILILQKRFDEAGEAVVRLPPGEARDHGLALLSHAMGHKTDADAATQRLAAESGQSPDIRLAEVYAFRGMIDEAFQALQGVQDAVERDEPAMASQLWTWQVEMRVSPFLVPLHGDPRWTAMMVEPG
jgi:TolB-like protein/DNA-binding winged helix-turn-helix (wHTH) protein/thioredoxin-like negative regulator of GroEL